MVSDWSFARRPFWVFSHLFAVTVVVTFVLLGLWQLSRHQERADFNDLVTERANPPAQPLAEVLSRTPADLEFQLVEGGGTYLDQEVVRVANRSQGGVAGQHVVALFQLDDGRLILVNRGFVPFNTSVELVDAPTGQVVIAGWLRPSLEKGWIGATDTGEGDLVPRLDVEAIGQRFDESTVAVWLQLAGSDEVARAVFPDPVPLPTLDAGPHLSYMGQWFIFAVLGAGFYVALLRRHAQGSADIAA